MFYAYLYPLYEEKSTRIEFVSNVYIIHSSVNINHAKITFNVLRNVRSMSENPFILKFIINMLIL